MDISKLLKNVNNLNKYISTTHDAAEKCRTSKIQLNMSSVLELMKIRSLEIKYFNKYEENGIAIIIIERMLRLPASKTWGVLGKELVTLLQYWLDALRKNLVNHNVHWWKFLKLLLGFIWEIRQKDLSLPNILVEQTSECLLDLATSNLADAMQCQLILHCLNMFSSESSRDIRLALRNKFGNYFIKLSSYMATCGYLPCQYSILETLLRWLLPRQDLALRQASADKWFPTILYSKTIVDIFMERSWMNFYHDARDLLNIHNKAGELITSVACKHLTIGAVDIVDEGKQDAWLDLNVPSKCMSVLLAPQALHSLGSRDNKTFETLVISVDTIRAAKLYREDKQIMISVSRIRPQSQISTGPENSDVTAMLTSQCDLRRLDRALRNIFSDKYQLLMTLEDEVVSSKETTPQKVHKQYPQVLGVKKPEVKKVLRSGHLVLPVQTSGWKSPSTASTTSLAQLHDRLAALPRFRFDKEKVSVCAELNLSAVTELSESDSRLTHRRRYGICYQAGRKSQSDSELNKSKHTQVDDSDNTSCLLVATIGSDESLINETKERLAKRKDYNEANIVDMLTQEAIEATANVIDSGIISGCNKSQNFNDAIENTPCEVAKGGIKPAKVVDSTTTDESNAEFINETPNQYVNLRRNRKKTTNRTESVRKQSFDEQIIEEFFSQHINQNKVGDVIVSPTLARKINESSSEASDLDDNQLIEDHCNVESYVFDNIDVIECLNNMVDKVCEALDKCTESLQKGDEIVIVEPTEDMPLQDIMNTIQSIATKQSPKKATPKNVPKTKGIKLKYKIAPKKNVERAKTRSMRKRDKLGIERTEMSTIIEDNTAEAENIDIHNEIIEDININAKNNDFIDTKAVLETKKVKSDSTKATESNTPLLRRKRKLYSPKDDQIEKSVVISETEDDDIALSEFKIKNTPKRKATCYKEIERDRKKLIRQPRNRRSKSKVEPPSPRTRKYNDIFDKLKETSEGERVKLVDKDFEVDVYNFSSDSEDEHFKKKINLRKRNSSTTVCSMESAISTRGRQINRINYTENKPQTQKNKRKITKRKRFTKDIVQNELIDERMRSEETKEVLNTSIVVKKSLNAKNPPELLLEKPLAMEAIDDIETAPKKTAKKIKTESKKSNKKQINKLNIQDDRTKSPLPGLVVESVVDKNNDIDLSTINKLEKICQDGPENYVNESNTTQNMLVDVEKTNSSHIIDITEEFEDYNRNFEFNRKNIRKVQNNTKNITIKPNTRESIKKLNNISEIDTANSERSIATEGITAHGDMDETPPDLTEEPILPRIIEVDNMEADIKEYFFKLNKEMDRSDDEKAMNSDKSCNNLSSPGNKSLIVSVERLFDEDISRWLPSRRSSDSDSNRTEDLPKRSDIETRSESNKTKVEQSQENIRASIISPIKLFGELNSNHDNSETSASDDEVMTDTLKKVMTRLRNGKRLRKSPPKSKDSKQFKDDINRNGKDKKFKRNNEKSSISIDTSPNSDVSSSTKIVEKLDGSRKRVSAFDRVDVKRHKGGEPETLAATFSSVTASSIDDWFKRNQPSSSREDTSVMTRDYYQNVLERLNTTLDEIHQNTSKQFVHLFVDAQRHLSELKQVQRDNFKQIASELIAGFVNILDDKFNELDKKSQEMQDDFMKQLRESASQFIREDCKHKRLMVRLLKEDVEAVVRHMDKKGNTSSE